MMTESVAPDHLHAILNVILNQPVGDYLDVVDAVQKQFGLKVSQREVELVYVKMKEQARDPASESRAASVGSAREKSVASDQIARSFQFVQEVGGFQKARELLDRLESLVSKL